MHAVLDSTLILTTLLQSRADLLHSCQAGQPIESVRVYQPSFTGISFRGWLAFRVFPLFRQKDVGWDIISAVANMQAIAGRIGEEIQTVKLGFSTSFGGVIETTLFPDVLPFWLNLLGNIRRPFRIRLLG